MSSRQIIKDSILKLFSGKTKEWYHKPFETSTKTRLSPKPREMHARIFLSSIYSEDYSIKNGFHQQMEIIPPEIYNYLSVESRIGNYEGTGYSHRIEKIEEGNPSKISLESLEQVLGRLYKEAKTESFDSFVNAFSSTNRHSLKKHLESLIITSSTGRKKNIKNPELNLFYKLKQSKPIVFVEESNSRKDPGSNIQNLLSQIDKELRGRNEINKNGFQTFCQIQVINETDRYANSESSMIRTGFSGYNVFFEISFDSLKSGKSCIEYGIGIGYSDIRKHKNSLLKKAREINQIYNEFFNNENVFPIESGKWHAYLEPRNTAFQLHEAIVHSCSSDSIVEYIKSPESDGTFERSFTIEDFNTEIGSKNLNIVFNPKKKINGRLCWGGFYYDHEGIESKRFHIIKNGKLRGIISDREDSYLINNILQEELVKPGASRFGKTIDSRLGEIFPRTGVLELRWSKDITKKQLWSRFLRLIKKDGREVEYKGEKIRAGLWFKHCNEGEYTQEGNSKVFGNLAYIVFENGEYLPANNLIYTNNSPRTILQNIQGIASRNEHVTSFCGVGKEGELLVRESIFTGPSIIKELEIQKVNEVPKR